MRVNVKINMDKDGLMNNEPITIIAFDDSVTHGAFSGYNNYEATY